MVDIIELKTASYGGVEFLFTEAPTRGGNRIIKYNFPGSDKQSIERQGKFPRSHGMTIWIQHEDYFQKRDELLRVLEDGISKTLTHPTFGDVDDIINGPYQLDEKITELGRASIKVTFELNNAVGIPQQSGNLASQVQAASDALNSQLASDLGDNYDVSTNLLGNFSDALESVENAVDAIGQAAQVVTPLTEGLAQFRARIARVSGAIGDLIQAPAQLAEEIDGLFADLNNLFAAPGDALAAFQSLFGFGNSDQVIVPTTVAKSQRKKNRGLIRAALQAKALSYAYLNASEGTTPTTTAAGDTVAVLFTTTDDLDFVQDALEAQYIVSVDAEIITVGPLVVTTTADETVRQLISNESLELMDRVRVQAQKVLEEARINTRSIITVETPRIPLSVFVYAYYGSTDLTDEIAELNNIKLNAFVEGELRILTV